MDLHGYRELLNCKTRERVNYNTYNRICWSSYIDLQYCNIFIFISDRYEPPHPLPRRPFHNESVRRYSPLWIKCTRKFPGIEQQDTWLSMSPLPVVKGAGMLPTGDDTLWIWSACAVERGRRRSGQTGVLDTDRRKGARELSCVCNAHCMLRLAHE